MWLRGNKHSVPEEQADAVQTEDAEAETTSRQCATLQQARALLAAWAVGMQGLRGPDQIKGDVLDGWTLAWQEVGEVDCTDCSSWSIDTHADHMCYIDTHADHMRCIDTHADHICCSNAFGCCTAFRLAMVVIASSTFSCCVP